MEYVTVFFKHNVFHLNIIFLLSPDLKLRFGFKEYLKDSSIKIASITNVIIL